MGDVKDAVKGPKKLSPSLTENNLVERLTAMADEVSDLIQKKDEDTLSEGDAVRPENTRKAATLRAAHSLLNAAKRLFEDY